MALGQSPDTDGSGADQLRQGPRGVVGALLLLIALIGWEYAPSLRGGFVYEDYRMTDACTAMNPTGTSSVWTSSFWRGRVVTRATWCWHVAREDGPLAYRLVNLGFHLAMTGLVAGLLWTLTRAVSVTAVAAAFFGLNAVNVEAVAYLSSRSELIAALGVLTACLAALAGRWWLVALALLVGLGGKETAVLGLVLVPLCLWWQRRGIWGWLTALAAVTVGSALLSTTASWWWTMDAWAWFRQQTVAIARVTLLAVLPFGQTVDYDYARVPVALAWLAVVAAAGAVIVVCRHRQAAPLVWFGTAWLLLSLAPRVLVPTPLSIFPEHQLYLPMVGMALALAGMLVKDTRDDYCPAL